MTDYSIEKLNHLPKESAERVSRGHQEYETRHGVVCDYKPFAFVAHSSGGETIGALSGYAAYAEIYVDDIWVDLKHRRRGIGRKLLDALEAAYSNQGYNNINLVTNRFQAPEFYKKCGFEVEHVRENTSNPKLSKMFFVKYFRDGPETRGIRAAGGR